MITTQRNENEAHGSDSENNTDDNNPTYAAMGGDSAADNNNDTLWLLAELAADLLLKARTRH